MSLFRSEAHIEAWLKQTGHARGEVLSIEQTWRLAKAWYADPRDPAWRPRTIEESQRVLESVGLVSEFWRLQP